MSEPRISGGYILLSRKLIESEIWRKPPLYLKVWVYLLSRAQHRQYRGLKRGQLRTSIPEIQEACSWYVGYRKEQPTYDQVYGVIEWLRKRCERSGEHNTNANMITTTKATHGILVDIVNYDFYQDPKNYEANYEASREQVAKPERTQKQPDNTNKNGSRMDKNDNNVDAELSQIMTLFAELFGLPNSTHMMMINSFLEDGLTPWHVKEALNRAAEANATHPNYVKQILQSWVKEQAFTKADVEEIEKRHERIKQQRQGQTESPKIRMDEFYLPGVDK